MKANKKSLALSFVADLAFLLFAALYAWLAMQGIEAISADGALIDGDLQTYAQGMAGEYQPDFFRNDPVLNSGSAANSIPNLQRMLADFLMPQNAYAIGLLRAGALAIFVFYSLWYLFGRWLFQSPAMAAILALAMGVTVWTGWGTFWGITHSDPVPRVFFAALLPLLLYLALAALRRPFLRPVAMFCAGLGMWAHGVNALNCGAMFLLAFFLIPAPKTSLREHLFNILWCIGAFLAPVLLFLWPSLTQKTSFSAGDLAVFQKYMAVRWHQDFAGFGARILEFLSPGNPTSWILATGMLSWPIALWKGGQRIRDLCKMTAAFVLALVLVTLFCWAETRYAPQFGRLPMGHELVRGLRFLVPLSWLMAACALFCLTGRLARRLFLAVLLVCLVLKTTDRQYEAAQFALYSHTGLRAPLVAKAEQDMREARTYREMIEELARIVPAGDRIFSSGEDMAIRHIALRPLEYTFKDGYVYFYNKDMDSAEKWLKYEKLVSSQPDGFIDAWLESGAPWLLLRSAEYTPRLEREGMIKMRKNGWILLRRTQDPDNL